MRSTLVRHMDRHVSGLSRHDLRHAGPVDEDRLFKRMVVSEVEPDAFHRCWESSPDGTAWVERWAIDYRRTT
jgi:hypothetical protein